MEELALKIVKGDRLVYLVQGSEEFKTSLLKAVEDYAGGTATLTDHFLIPSSYKESPDDGAPEDIFFDLLTVRILKADFLFFHIPEPKGISGARVKEIVHGDFFELYYHLLGRGASAKPRRLVIVSTNPFDGSDFEKEAALRSRCEFL